MTKQPPFKGKIFSNEKPISETVKVRIPYAKLFVIIWVVILIPLIFYGFLSKSDQNLNFYLIVIHFIFSISFFILIKFSFEKEISKLYEAQVYIQKKLTSLENLSSLGKPSIDTSATHQVKNIINSQSEFHSRLSDLENKIYPHLALSSKIDGSHDVNGKSNSKDQIPISVQDLIGALNFPKDETDSEGFRKLRIALADSENGDLLRASQDVQTLLSQDGIYMDDLIVECSQPMVWRNFSKGHRGPTVQSLWVIEDNEIVFLISKKLNDDEIFRDTVNHFLRHFDSSLSELCKKANDSELLRFSDTRTARAFKLLGTATGRFN
ncbi:MAG: hypothetical protein ACI8Y9_001427 [Paracoccaceae bacterium]|jgi:hypothetical protein|tara:strand:- start:1638 stop:2606 length:969 start_codon:yes stop_codon:yes gene_type:complete